VFVYGELSGGEGYGHRERRWVRDVKGGYPFFSKDGARTGDNGAEFGLVYLHSLFYDYAGDKFGPRFGIWDEHGAPSKGFMSASLAIVAVAPARAGTPPGQSSSPLSTTRGSNREEVETYAPITTGSHFHPGFHPSAPL
jgi:hypothetical protein